MINDEIYKKLKTATKNGGGPVATTTTKDRQLPSGGRIVKIMERREGPKSGFFLPYFRSIDRSPDYEKKVSHVHISSSVDLEPRPVLRTIV